jgi:hypothetical protein
MCGDRISSSKVFVIESAHAVKMKPRNIALALVEASTSKRSAQAAVQTTLGSADINLTIEVILSCPGTINEGLKPGTTSAELDNYLSVNTTCPIVIKAGKQKLYQA